MHRECPAHTLEGQDKDKACRSGLHSSAQRMSTSCHGRKRSTHKLFMHITITKCKNWTWIVQKSVLAKFIEHIQLNQWGFLESRFLSARRIFTNARPYRFLEDWSCRRNRPGTISLLSFSSSSTFSPSSFLSCPWRSVWPLPFDFQRHNIVSS